jgi:CubicO group peptidase (beta-lactamase class C family)
VFLQTFLNGGVYGGVRLLKPETIELMTTRQTPAAAGAAGSYGFGWQLMEEGIYAHGGSDGTFAWVDPGRQIIGLVFTQTPAGRNPRDKFMELVKLAVDQQRPRT